MTTWLQLTESIDEPALICGEIDPKGASELKKVGKLVTILPAAERLRRAGYLAELAWNRIRRRDTDDPATLTPSYIKHPS